jgi:hypothetical protein
MLVIRDHDNSDSGKQLAGSSRGAERQWERSTAARHYIGGMNNLNAQIAGEAGLVESKNRCEAMNAHGGHQPRIMRRFSRNPVLHDKRFPNRMDGRCLGKKIEKRFQPRQILRHDMKFLALLRQTLNCAIGQRVERVMRLQGSQKNIAIDKHGFRTLTSCPGKCCRG